MFSTYGKVGRLQPYVVRLWPAVLLELLEALGQQSLQLSSQLHSRLSGMKEMTVAQFSGLNQSCSPQDVFLVDVKSSGGLMSRLWYQKCAQHHKFFYGRDYRELQRLLRLCIVKLKFPEAPELSVDQLAAVDKIYQDLLIFYKQVSDRRYLWVVGLFTFRLSDSSVVGTPILMAVVHHFHWPLSPQIFLPPSRSASVC